MKGSATETKTDGKGGLAVYENAYTSMKNGVWAVICANITAPSLTPAERIWPAPCRGWRFIPGSASRSGRGELRRVRRHCEEPLCVKGCISGALTVEKGVIAINRDKCVGCYTCILSCPYGAIMPSPEGAVQKCELCVRNKDGEPACVKGCPNRAIVFEER